MQKWTGSSHLSQRFRENILSDPKSFTRRDLSSLRSQYDILLADLRESLPEDDSPDSPESLSIGSRSNSVQYSTEAPATPPRQHFAPLPQPVHYWNEYDDGSEAGDRDEDDYAIYINPDEDMHIPGLEFIKSTLAQPLATARSFFTLRAPWSVNNNNNNNNYGGERAPLLGAFHTPTGQRQSDTEDEYTSCDELPSDGYATHYAAFPSVHEQRATLQRDTTLFWVTVGSFVVSFVLIAITSALIATGRHKMRLEVEAGVTVGIITSLFSACVGLGITMTRTDDMPIWHHISLWLAFLSVCVLNGMLLVLVMEW